MALDYSFLHVLKFLEIIGIRGETPTILINKNWFVLERGLIVQKEVVSDRTF